MGVTLISYTCIKGWKITLICMCTPWHLCPWLAFWFRWPDYQGGWGGGHSHKPSTTGVKLGQVAKVETWANLSSQGEFLLVKIDPKVDFRWVWPRFLWCRSRPKPWLASSPQALFLLRAWYAITRDTRHDPDLSSLTVWQWDSRFLDNPQGLTVTFPNLTVRPTVSFL
jgi:hypothetical protein